MLCTFVTLSTRERLRATALRTLIEAIGPRPEDTIVTLGDYIDWGPDWGRHSNSAAGGGAVEKCGTSIGPLGQ